ncbi:aromatic di-alanine and TPR containing protein [Ceratobasidium sp. AG-Ba]|nr:aromatic di-alanine and TPR containing protein [Ceratobasidium sp. AG-Ba]
MSQLDYDPASIPRVEGGDVSLLTRGKAADVWLVKEQHISAGLSPRPNEARESRGGQYIIKVLRIDAECFPDSSGEGIVEPGSSAAQFIQEFRSKTNEWSKLKHSNLVEVFGLKTLLELRVEYCCNGSAPQYLKHRSYNLNVKMRMIQDVLEGVNYLHSQSPAIVHGSLSASKIFVDHEGRSKVGEFGLGTLTTSFSLLADNIFDSEASRWMSPELVDPELEEDPTFTTASDVWAFGCTVSEIIIGEVPFARYKHELKARLAIHKGERPWPASALKPVSPRWSNMITACWSYSTEARPNVSTINQAVNPSLINTKSTRPDPKMGTNSRSGTNEPSDWSKGNPRKGISAISNNHARKYLGSSKLARAGGLRDSNELTQTVDQLYEALNGVRRFGRPPELLINLGSILRLHYTNHSGASNVAAAIDKPMLMSELMSVDDSNQAIYLESLGVLFYTLSHLTGRTKDFDRSVHYMSNAVQSYPTASLDLWICLARLGLSLLTRAKNREDIDKTIEYLERALAHCPEDHTGRLVVLSGLGKSFQLRFDHLKIMNDLDLSIMYHRQLLDGLPDHSFRTALCLCDCGVLYGMRYKHTKSSLDSKMAALFFQAAIPLLDSSLGLQIIAYEVWTKILFETQDSARFIIFDQAMELVQRAMSFGSTTSRCIDRIQRLLGRSGRAATEAISLGHYDLALKWLEQSRTFSFSHSINSQDLQVSNPEIAAELREVVSQLEAFTRPHSLWDCLFPGLPEEPYDLQKLGGLTKHRDDLIDRVRKLPGFMNFGRPLSASQIAHCVASGIVVVIHMNKPRCDAFIIQAGRQAQQAVNHIPLPGLSQFHLVPEYQTWRPEHQSRFPSGLREVLSRLWSDVVKPVLDFLGINKLGSVDELPHIRWCTAHPLSRFPIHAAGDYSRAETALPNLAISSYIPNVGSLGRTAHASEERPFVDFLEICYLSMAIYAQPFRQHRPGFLEVRPPGLRHTQLIQGDASLAPVLEAMKRHNWIHFTGHVTVDTKDPMNLVLQLVDATLDLATLSQTHLNKPELAFLCVDCEPYSHAFDPVRPGLGLYPTPFGASTLASDYMAPIDSVPHQVTTNPAKDSMPDDATHFAYGHAMDKRNEMPSLDNIAAMDPVYPVPDRSVMCFASGLFMAGCSNVIATSWATWSDDDWRVANRVYEILWKGGLPGSQTAAKALHVAVKSLRDEVGVDNFQRWVPYMHLGA